MCIAVAGLAAVHGKVFGRNILTHFMVDWKEKGSPRVVKTSPEHSELQDPTSFSSQALFPSPSASSCLRRACSRLSWPFSFFPLAAAPLILFGQIPCLRYRSIPTLYLSAPFSCSSRPTSLLRALLPTVGQPRWKTRIITRETEPFHHSLLLSELSNFSFCSFCA